MDEAELEREILQLHDESKGHHDQIEQITNKRIGKKKGTITKKSSHIGPLINLSLNKQQMLPICFFPKEKLIFHFNA